MKHPAIIFFLLFLFVVTTQPSKKVKNVKRENGHSVIHTKLFGKNKNRGADRQIQKQKKQRQRGKGRFISNQDFHHWQQPQSQVKTLERGFKPSLTNIWTKLSEIEKKITNIDRKLPYSTSAADPNIGQDNLNVRRCCLTLSDGSPVFFCKL